MSAKLSKEESFYLKKIMKEWDLIYFNVYQKKTKNKFNSYKELYESMINDEKLVLRLQEILSDKESRDIEHLFIGNNKKTLARQHLNTLYGTDTTIPINQMFMKKVKYMLEKLDIKKEPN